MPRIIALDGTNLCACGMRWVLVIPKPWGTRFVCASNHSKDILPRRASRTRAVETMGGRGGYEGASSVIKAPPIWVRFRVWLWRTRRRLARASEEGV